MPRYQFPGPGPGRPKGSLGRDSKILKEALVEALREHGQDGKGKGELVGFFRWALAKHPKEVIGLVSRVLPLTLDPDPSDPQTFATVEEVQAELKARGLPAPRIFGELIEGEVVDLDPASGEPAPAPRRAGSARRLK